ncbi:la protein homolog [Periplaneta americana]|uniref:la protein homolog n=1 Tax=Periplaneta americana TaxID=6978 RepID=UPI0037E788EA
MAEGDANGVREEKIPTLNSQIVRQIEYYFGDINLPRDKFLQEQIKLDDGWVPLDVMLKFKRLSNLTTDCDVIVSALKASELMEVSEDKKKIRRNPGAPLPVFNEERRKELMTRTVYCKGFPLETTTLDKLLEFFNAYGPIDNVQMRSYKDKKENKFVFKGSVFVIFKTKELATKFLDQDVVKYEDIDLLKKWQSIYIEDKRKERMEKKMNSKKPSNSHNVKQERKQKDELPKGAILHLKGMNGETTMEDIREKLMNEGLDVAYVDFKKGDNDAWIRLIGENSSKEFVEKLEDKKLEICGSEVEARALEGEEETKFLEKAKEDMEKRRQQASIRSRKGRRGGRGGGRGGRGGYTGKRKGSPVRGGPPTKQAVKEGENEAEAAEDAADSD